MNHVVKHEPHRVVRGRNFGFYFALFARQNSTNANLVSVATIRRQFATNKPVYAMSKFKVWLCFLFFFKIFVDRIENLQNENDAKKNESFTNSPNFVIVLTISMPSLVQRYLCCCRVCKRLDKLPQLLVLIPSLFQLFGFKLLTWPNL